MLTTKTLSKILITAFAILGFHGAANAQNVVPRFGAKVGVGVSKITGDVTGASFGLNYGLGPVAVFDFNQFSIATELYFARRTYGTTVGNTAGSGSSGSTKMWDMTIPLLVRYYPTPMFFAELGGFFSYGLGSVTVEPLTPSSYSYKNAGVSKADFGLSLGGGADFGLDNGNSVQTELRFNWGFKDRSTNAVTNRKSISLELSAAYLF